MNTERWGWYSIGINILLIGINAGIQWTSGSLAVRAELVHNMVDLVSAVGVLIGLKLATRKTREFPYGLYKIENVIAVILAGLAFFTAYEIVREALTAEAIQVRTNLWVLLGIILAAAIPLVFSFYEMKVGKENNSPALMADAREYRVHAYTTGIILAAFIGQYFNLPLDRYAAIVIVLAVLKTGWDLLSDSMRVLLDASLDADTLLEIREIILREPAVTSIQNLTGRNAGRFRFIEAEVCLRVSDLEKAHNIVHDIGERIRQEIPFVDRVLIHPEPQSKSHLHFAMPLDDPENSISDLFGEAPRFIFWKMRLEDGSFEDTQIRYTPQITAKHGRGIRVAEWLVSLKVDVVLTIENPEGKGPGYVFANAGVELKEPPGETIQAVKIALAEEYK